MKGKAFEAALLYAAPCKFPCARYATSFETTYPAAQRDQSDTSVCPLNKSYFSTFSLTPIAWASRRLHNLRAVSSHPLSFFLEMTLLFQRIALAVFPLVPPTRFEIECPCSSSF